MHLHVLCSCVYIHVLYIYTYELEICIRTYVLEAYFQCICIRLARACTYTYTCACTCTYMIRHRDRHILRLIVRVHEYISMHTSTDYQPIAALYTYAHANRMIMRLMWCSNTCGRVSLSLHKPRTSTRSRANSE